VESLEIPTYIYKKVLNSIGADVYVPFLHSCALDMGHSHCWFCDSMNHTRNYYDCLYKMELVSEH